MLWWAFYLWAVNGRDLTCVQAWEWRYLLPFPESNSRRALYLNKTMQLSKPVHGLRETYLHEFLQTVSYVFWNANWELFRKDVLLEKNSDKFFEGYLLKRKGRVGAVTLVLNYNTQLSSHAANPLHAVFPRFTSVRLDTFGSAINFISSISCFFKILLFNLNYSTIIWIHVIQKNSSMC